MNREYRVNGKTGKGSWHTRHEWDVINGYAEDVEVIEGEVVEEPTAFQIGGKMARREAVARYVNHLLVNRKIARPTAKEKSVGEDIPTNPTMHEPC